MFRLPKDRRDEEAGIFQKVRRIKLKKSRVRVLANHSNEPNSSVERRRKLCVRTTDMNSQRHGRPLADKPD